MVYSNEVEITVVSELGITSVSLSADKTYTYVGDTINLTVTVKLNRKPTSNEASMYEIWGGLIVNGSRQRDIKLSDLSTSKDTYVSTIQFKPNAAGKYTIKIDAYITASY